MKNSKRKLTIFLADLTHTGMLVATENIPLNIGIIASYAIKKFNANIQIRLFKYPKKLFRALQNEKCDILGCSTYIWNNNLSEWACEVAKKHNPEVITVRGGWNFPLDEKQQEEYLKKHRFTDIFCLGEGEKAFANIIERVLASEESQNWRRKPLDGCAFINNLSMVKGHALPRIKDLDMIPSPYVTGLLDEFFDGKLTPIIETSRGCPFKCDYCNNSDSYYDAVSFFTVGYVREEINYIAKKIHAKGIRNLMITDTNYGMYPRDKSISVILKETREKYKWPLGIVVSTGKNDIKKILDNTDPLGNALTINMSVQSMNQNTIKIIKRENINARMYEEISSAMEKQKRSQMAEVIVPLPGETYESYMEGIDKLLRIGAKRIMSYTLQLNNGTIYKDDEYRKKYGYRGMYRLIPYDFGTYNEKKVFDYEEVGTFTNDLCFEEYLKIRKFALLMELLYSNAIFAELFKFLGENGIRNYQFLTYVVEKLDNESSAVKEVFDSFVSETSSELTASGEILVKYYSDEKIYEKLKRGEVGGNVIFKHKGIMLRNYMALWARYVFTCAEDIVKAHKPSDKRNLEHEINDIKSFSEAKLDGLFNPGQANDGIIIDLKYDVPSWFRDERRNSLKDFEAVNGSFKYKFYFDEVQIMERDDLFARYGDDVYGISRILARVPGLDRMFRRFERVDQE